MRPELIGQEDGALPDGLAEVAVQLGSVFGPGLRLERTDSEWLKVEVSGLTDRCVFMTIDREREQIFGPDLWDYQILCPTDQTIGQGVWIHDLSDPYVRAEHRVGFWYY